MLVTSPPSHSQIPILETFLQHVACISVMSGYDEYSLEKLDSDKRVVKRK